MRFSIIIIILIMAALIVTCANDGPTGPGLSGGVIMPLEMGNKWYGTNIFYYESGSTEINSVEMEIKDTIYNDNECWYLTMERGFRPRHGYLNRSDGLYMTIFESDNQTGDPILYCKYPARVGDIYAAGNAQAEVLRLDTIDIASIGAVESMLYYYYIPDSGSAITQYIWWTPNLGMIKMTYTIQSDSAVYYLDSVDFTTP